MQQQPAVTPQPLPQSFGAQTVRLDDGQQRVMLVLQGVCGQWVTFFDAQSAKTLAAQLEQAASDCTGGLFVPPPGAGPNLGLGGQQ